MLRCGELPHRHVGRHSVTLSFSMVAYDRWGMWCEPGIRSWFGAGGQVVQRGPKCPTSRPLSPDERALLFCYCLNHAVARCPGCARSYHLSELVVDLLNGRTQSGSSAPRRRWRTPSITPRVGVSATCRSPGQAAVGGGATSADPAVASSIVRAVIAVHRSGNEHGSRRHDHPRSSDHRGGDRHENAAREARGDSSSHEQRSGQAAECDASHVTSSRRIGRGGG